MRGLRSRGCTKQRKMLPRVMENKKVVLTSDVYEGVKRPGGGQMGHPNGIVFASGRFEKRHRHCPRSR